MLKGTRQDRARELHETAYALRLAFHADDAKYQQAMSALDGTAKPADTVKQTMSAIMALIGAKT